MDVWIYGYMSAWIYVTKRKKYICAYIGLFYCIHIYIYKRKKETENFNEQKNN